MKEQTLSRKEETRRKREDMSGSAPPPPPFARGFDPQKQYSVVQLAQVASTQYMDLMEDLFHDGDVSDSTTTHRSPGLSRKSPATRTVRGREPPPTRILDFLYLGNVMDAKNTHFLHENNIKTIINVSTEQYWLDDNSIHVHSFVAHDTANFEIAPLFPVTSAIIEEVRRRHYSEKDRTKRERVLVHCQKGRSRSATTVIAYLIRSNGWTVHQALSYVVKRRDCVEPNIGFVEALREYQESFSADERRLPLARLCLHVRGVNESKSADEIAAFFESIVGPVMDVKRSAPKNAAASPGTSEGEGVLHAPTSQDGPALSPPGNGSSSNGPSEGESAAPANPAMLNSSGDPIPAPKLQSSAKQAVKPSGPLILVFFACTESVDAAHSAFKRNKQIFAPLADDLEKLRLVPARSAPVVSRVLQRITTSGQRSGVASAQEELSGSPEAGTCQVDCPL